MVLDVKAIDRHGVPTSDLAGWAFQYANPHYPDLDDTAVVVMALYRMRKRQPTREYETAIVRAREWIEGLLSRQRRLGSVRRRHTYYYLNEHPFADHVPARSADRRCHGALYFHVGSTRRTA